MKHASRPFIPPSIRRWAGPAYDWVRRLPRLPDAYLHPWRRMSRARIAALRNAHRGERCFIIGNGPSLRDTDLTRLNGKLTFGVNRVYLLFDQLGFHTTYYVSINDLVVEQCATDIAALQSTKFIAWHANRHFRRLADDMVFLYTTYTGPRFADDLSGRIWEGATVTNVALQIAFFLGFQQAILVGVDHSFSTKGSPNQTVVSSGADPDHFSPEYFGRGFRWQLPDLATSEAGYRLARDAFARAGREVLDATIGGKLNIFPRVAYDSLF